MAPYIDTNACVAGFCKSRIRGLIPGCGSISSAIREKLQYRGHWSLLCLRLQLDSRIQPDAVLKQNGDVL